MSRRRRSNVHPVEERRVADLSRAVIRLLEVFCDIILPRLNENCCVVFGVAVISSQSIANLIPFAGGSDALGGLSL